MALADPSRPAWALVDLAAVRHNVGVLRRRATPSAVWAVVKADGYGHGAVRVAEAAVDAGAEGLCVAIVSEAEELRAAGIQVPILLLSQPPLEQAARVRAARLDVTVSTAEGIDALEGNPMHLKLDTGMHRTGAPPADAVALARRCGPDLAAVWTHCAIADEPDDPFTSEQLDRFDLALAAIAEAGIDVPCTHAANSAATLAHPRARRSFVRAGITVYGLAPSAAVAEHASELRPALSLMARVASTRWVRAGERSSYGLRYTALVDTQLATVPIGYADGVPRRLFHTGGGVLIGGRRRPLAGVVTMDQLIVDCGPSGEVGEGDEVVLIGAQGAERIGVEDWAQRLGTIVYEITCGIGARVPRRYVG